MNENDGCFIVIICVAIFLGLSGILYEWGDSNGTAAMQRQIVERGYGDFVVNKDLEVEFKWKENNE